MPLPDYEIEARMSRPIQSDQRMTISPFAQCMKAPGLISYGLQPYGYDLRLGCHFAKIEGNIDPKNFPDTEIVDVRKECEDENDCNKTELVLVHGTTFTIEPNTSYLACSVERIEMPFDCLGSITGKSTYARCGLIVNTTAIEPGWCGNVTLELCNPTNNPITVYPGEGIAQLVLHDGHRRPQSSYSSTEHSKFNNASGIQFPPKSPENQKDAMPKKNAKPEGQLEVTAASTTPNPVGPNDTDPVGGVPAKNVTGAPARAGDKPSPTNTNTPQAKPVAATGVVGKPVEPNAPEKNTVPVKGNEGIKAGDPPTFPADGR